MIIETIKRISKLSLFLHLFFTLGCESSRECQQVDNEKIIQEYTTSKEIFSLFQVDHGALGYDVTLRICSNNELIEEIGLRGEDYLPTIDSVANSTVYIHYSFPRETGSKQLELLKFEDVALGEVLIDRGKLKYKYVFYNKVP